MSEDERMEEGREDEESTTDKGRRDMIKSAAALAAAALGGAALAAGGEAQAQVGGVQTQPRLNEEQLRNLQRGAQASPLAQNLQIGELPMRNLGNALENVNQQGLNRFNADLQEYLTPLLDKNRGQVSDVTCSVGASVNVSG